MKIAHGVESDITEALDDNGLAGQTGTESNHVHVLLVVGEDLESLPDSSAGGRDTSVDSSRDDGLTGDAGGGILEISGG